jgi:hypothetical protein
MSMPMGYVTFGDHYVRLVIHEDLVDGVRWTKLKNRTKQTAKLQCFVRVGR